jgi:hypothetical protein
MGESIFVGLPVYAGVNPETMGTIVDLLTSRAGMTLDVVTGVQVHIARSELMGRALDAGADHFLSLDGDVSFRPEVLSAMLAARGDIVLAPYTQRNASDWALRTARGGARLRTVGGAGRLLSIECCALGATLISRAALVRMAEHYRGELAYVSDAGAARVHLCEPRIAERDGVRRATEDDYAFSDRARAVGLSIEALCDVVVTHAGKTGRLADVLAATLASHAKLSETRARRAASSGRRERRLPS